MRFISTSNLTKLTKCSGDKVKAISLLAILLVSLGFPPELQAALIEKHDVIVEPNASSHALSADNLPGAPINFEEAQWLVETSESLKCQEPENIESGDAASAALASPVLSNKVTPEMGASSFVLPEGRLLKPVLKPPSAELAAANENAQSIPSFSGAEDAHNAVEDLTRRILLKEVALEKFNLNYKLNAAKQGRLKGWRYGAFGQANSALGLAGGILSVYNRGWHHNHASALRLDMQKRANIVPMIGTIIGAGAAALEFGINGFHEYEARKKGFSAGIARKHVDGLKLDIDKLMDERAALVKAEQASPALAAQAELHEIEGRVLTGLRDQSLLQFQRFHLGARRLLAFQQMQYFLDFATNVTGAIGFDFAWLSLHRGRRVWNYRAGVMYAISGGLAMGGPIVSRLFAKGVSEYHKRSIRETLQDAENKEVTALAKDKAELEAFCKSGKVHPGAIQDVLERCDGYGLASKHFEDELSSANKQLARSRLIASENVAAGLYTGGSRVAGGILFIIPGYYQLYNGRTETAGRITNSLLLAAGIVGLPSTGFKIFDTFRIQVRGEMDRHNLAKQGKLPGDLIKTRLSQLETTESRLKAK